MKAERIKLEHLIYEMIYSDNQNTPHFDYHVMFEQGKIRLDLYTYNPRSEEFLFVYSVIGETPLSCLNQMINYLKDHQYNVKKEQPVSVMWRRKGEKEWHESYYFGDPLEIKQKFLFGKNEEDYEIDIKINPLT